MRSNRKGTLQNIPKAEIIWGEPMIVCEISSDTYLCISPPLLPESSYEEDKDHATKEYIQLKTVKKTNRLFHNQTQHKIAQSKQYKLTKGTQILARPFEQQDPRSRDKTEMIINPFALQAAVIKQKQQTKKSDMPESGREVEVIESGFIFWDTISDKSKEYYKPVDEDIFPEGKSGDPSDIRQSAFGDCFLLAAISSVLSAEHGIQFFMDAMHQDKLFTIVRLFDPNTKEPVYLKVLNSYFCEGEDTTVAHRVPWIHLLEKAYAGFAYQQKAGKKEAFYSHPSFRVMYGEGGNSFLAFRILTGKDAVENEINVVKIARVHPWSLTDCNDAMSRAENLQLAKKIAEEDANPSIFTDKVINYSNDFTFEHYKQTYECFQNFDNFIQWGEFLLQLKQSNAKDFDVLMALITTMDKEQKRVTRDQALELPDLLQKLNAPQQLIDAIRKYIFHPIVIDDVVYHRYPGAIEDASYTKDQLDLFNNLKELLASNHPLTASTLTEFTKPGSTMKVEIEGLRAHHAYALLDVKEQKIDGKTHYFLRLKNPWGAVGRAYLWDKQKSIGFIREEHAFGTFWLELSDFTRYFRSYTVCEPIPGLELKHTFAQESARKPR